MKKMLFLMMCCLAVAFTSCRPDPEPEPEPTPAAPNEAFLGYYSGNIYLNGVATAPQFQIMGIPDQPIDSMEFVLTANITAGDNDNSVNVLFTIDKEEYNTTGTVNGSEVSFGVLSYTYVEESSTFCVNLDLTGNLDNQKDKLSLTGPFEGTGNVIFEGFPIPVDLTATGTVNGSLTKVNN